MTDGVQISLGDSTMISHAHAVRRAVFQKEQGISALDDCDGKDREATQVIYWHQAKPIGTMRLRAITEGVWKLERMAVLPNMRGTGVASAMIREAMLHVKHLGARVIVLDAQQKAIGLYTRHGFLTEGDVFEEVGIPHVTMRLLL